MGKGQRHGGGERDFDRYLLIARFLVMAVMVHPVKTAILYGVWRGEERKLGGMYLRHGNFVSFPTYKMVDPSAMEAAG